MYVTVCLLLCTLLAAVTLKNCAFFTAVYFRLLCNGQKSSSLSGQSTDHYELVFSNYELAMNEGLVMEKSQLAYCTHLCRLGLQVCHMVFVVNSQLRKYSWKFPGTKSHCGMSNATILLRRTLKTEYENVEWGVMPDYRVVMRNVGNVGKTNPIFK
jgi:hypothetical protein